jgi:hypothetical protein
MAYVWWYDHEGAIQSHGINFVLDLSYFLILLLVFQQFSMDNWGTLPQPKHNLGLPKGQFSIHHPSLLTCMYKTQPFSPDRNHPEMRKRAPGEPTPITD